jgi:hypothetical protein
MLRRANSKSSNRLSRRKSTSSIHTKQDYIGPEVARQQAQAAATYAFARAYERENIEMERNGGKSRNSDMLNLRRGADQNCEVDQRGQGLRRQQSVRFTGPEALPRRRSIGTRALQDSVEDKATASLRPTALTNNVPVPAAYRPPSRSSSIRKASIGKGTAQNIVTALGAYHEYYTREDDIASTPSSYCRMRKSKSTRTLASPSKAAKAPFNDIVNGNDYNTRIWNRVPWAPNQLQEAVLKAPKSMSFLRGGREHMTPAFREDHDNAVQMARDKFLHQIEQQRLREQPSFLFRAKAKKEKPFRQSVRSGSTNSYGLAVGSANQIIIPKEGSLRIKVRKASRTIRKKFKELFRRGPDHADDAKIPDQQVEACSSHRIISYVSISKEKDEFTNIPLPDSVAVSRVALRLPSLHSVPSSQQLKSRNGSVCSQRSDGSGKSRVTSWTSTVDNTATSRHAHAEREAQRLSIIQENGAHVSSASFARLGISNQFLAYPMFRSAQKRGGACPSGVDSQQVYSALMMRLEENSPMAKLDAQHIVSDEKFGGSVYVPPRSTSVSSRRSSRDARTPATIRHVQDDTAEWSDERHRQISTMTSMPHEDDDVFSAKPPLNTQAALGSQANHNDASIQPKVITKESSDVQYPLPGTSESKTLPPQQQAARKELFMKPLKPLRETRSTFFGNSSFAVNRTRSPYRRALTEADYKAAVTTSESSVGLSPNRILFAPPMVHCSDPKQVINEELVRSHDAYTESVYSRTTSGQVPATESSQSLALVQDDFRLADSGSVAFGKRETYLPTGPKKRVQSSSGSGRRKDSINLEVAMIGKSKVVDGMVSIAYALPSMPKYFGHLREHAQITDEHTEVSQRKVSMEKQPIGILQQAIPQSQPIPLKPILKHKSSVSLDGFPMLPPPPPPLPPPVPIRSPLRPMQSRASLRSVDATSINQTFSAPSSIIKQVPPSNHLLQRPKSLTNINCADTPAKLVKRAGRPLNNYKTSPGIGAAVERQFGSVGSRTPYSGSENCSPADAIRGDRFGSNSARHREMRDPEAQAMGSRVMVDMFLSSRRRRVVGSDESNAFL